MHTNKKVTLSAVLFCAITLVACGKDTPEALVASAKTYLAKPDYNAATIQLKSALQTAPNNAEARFLLGKILLITDQPALAETELRRAIDLKYPADEVYPVLAQALLAQAAYDKLVAEMTPRKLESPQAQAALKTAIATAYLGLGDVAKATAAVTEALSVAPGDAQALTVQAQIAALANDLPGAMKLVDSALAAAPKYPDALMLKAQLENGQGRPTDAIKTLERVIELYPQALNARFSLVAALVSTGQIDKAASQVDAMRKIAPQEFRTQYSDALVSYQKGDLSHAREVIQQVLAYRSTNLQSLYLSGLIDFKAGSYATAEEALRKVSAQAPNQTAPMRALAAVYLRTGRSAQGIELLESVLKSTPDDPGVLRAAAEGYLAAGNSAKAAQYYEKANSLDKDNMGSKVRLAQVKYAGGDTAQALKELEALATADSTEYQADLALITAHLRRGEYDQALAASDGLEKKQPSNPITYNIRGATYAGLRDFAKARASFEKALQLSPTEFAAARNLALLDIQEGKSEDARKRYEQLLAKDPQNEQLLLGLSELAALAGRPPEEVKAAIDKAIAAAPRSARPRIVLISYFSSLRDYKSALSAAQAAQAAFPNDPQIVEAFGVAQRNAGETSQALETFKRLTQLQPQNTTALLRVADTQLALKDYKEAIATLHRATGDGDDGQAWTALAKAYVVAGRPADAIAEARRLQKDRPTKALGFALEGEVQAAQKQWSAAAASYGAGLAREALPLLATRRYEALRNAAKNAEADAFAAQWTKDHPKDVALYSLIGQRAMQAKDYRTAVAQYQAALKIESDNAVFANNLAWLLVESGDPAALPYAERAYRQAPFNPNVMDTYGWALVQSGDTAKGTALLRAASNLAPTNAEIRLHFAKALVKGGDKPGARQALQPLLALDKTAPERADAEKLLTTL